MAGIHALLQINLKWYSWSGAFNSWTAKIVINVKDIQTYVLNTLLKIEFYGKHNYIQKKYH